MLFHSLEYAIFLVAVFVAYWLLVRLRALQLVLLLLASWLFYASSNPWLLTLLLASSLTDYVAGPRIAAADAAGRPRAKRAWLGVSLAVNLGLLGVFKYADFLYGSVVGVGRALGVEWTHEPLGLVLPTGISFYTFQTLSYSIDVYRGLVAPERSFLRFALFVGYFPQLLAGPIVRARDFLPQLQRRPTLSRDQASRAMWLIGIGLVKKVAIADYLAVNLVQRVFDAPDRFSSAEVLVGLYGYTMQIYMDFSAYSDIAIGSGLLFGFHLPDNFNRPYQATSVTDFWRRWHMTLGSWLRDYVYYPMGGARGTDLQTYRNLFVTFVAIGLWHGAGWTFVVYGALHATAMCINRYLRVNVRRRQPPAMGAWGWTWRMLLTLHFVVLARILFRARSFEHAGRVTDALLAGGFHLGHLAPSVLALLAGSYVVHWMPRRYVDRIGYGYSRLPAVVQGAVLAAVLLLLMRLASTQVVPFIYYRF